MKTFALNKDNDIMLDGSNSIAWVEGDDEIVQALKVRIFHDLGEWFLNDGLGFDRSSILTRNPDKERVIEAATIGILFDERIKAVENIEVHFNFIERKSKITFRAIKQDGEPLEGDVMV